MLRKGMQFLHLNIYPILYDKFKDIKGVIRSRRSRRTDNTGTKRKGQKDTQCSSKHFVENKRLINTIPTKHGVEPGALEG